MQKEIKIRTTNEIFVSIRANLDDPEWYDIAVVTSIIKQYFRELPTPLVTYSAYDKVIAALSEFSSSFPDPREMQIHLRFSSNRN